jgi:hypothetical protein
VAPVKSNEPNNLESSKPRILAQKAGHMAALNLLRNPNLASFK